MYETDFLTTLFTFLVSFCIISFFPKLYYIQLKQINTFGPFLDDALNWKKVYGKIYAKNFNY